MLASDGSVIATFYDENRVPVDLDEISPFLQNAIVAIEDERFREHGGFDPTGTLRAWWSTSSPAVSRRVPRR